MLTKERFHTHHWRLAAHPQRRCGSGREDQEPSDLVVYDGILNTYPKESEKDFTAQQAVDSLFSSWGLDNIWGDLGLPKDVADKVSSTVDGEVADLAQLPDTIAKLLPDDFSLQIASIIYSPKGASPCSPTSR